jgi:hypothetical protein
MQARNKVQDKFDRSSMKIQYLEEVVANLQVERAQLQSQCKEQALHMEKYADDGAFFQSAIFNLETLCQYPVVMTIPVRHGSVQVLCVCVCSLVHSCVCLAFNLHLFCPLNTHTFVRTCWRLALAFYPPTAHMLSLAH